MKKFAIICLLALLPTLAVAADSKRASVEELLVLTNVDETINQIYSQMDQIMVGVAQQLEMQPSEKEMFDKYMERMVAAMKKEMSWEKMKEPIIEIYLKHYTEKEIQDMISFYKSDTGRSMVQKMPAVMQDSMMVSQQMMQEFMPVLQQLSMDLQSELVETRSKQ